MFTLHERTRIALCRLGFILLCVLPTCCLLAAVWRYRSPEYIEARREEWQAVLSDKLGVDVAIARLTYPSWNTALLEDVQIVDPETGKKWITSRYVELLFAEGTWRIVAGQPEVDATALPRLQELLADRLLRGRAVKLGPLAFSAGEVTFRDATRAQTLLNVSAFIANIEHGKRAEFHFSIAGMDAKKTLEFVMERRHDGSSPRTLTAFHSGESEIPLDAFQPMLPWLDVLGKNAHFRGGMILESDAMDHTLEAAGNLRQVDLQHLIAARLPHHKLTGLAEIAMETLQLKNGTIAVAKGTVRTQGGGEVSRSLLDALGQRLDLAPKQSPTASPQQRVRYGHLAFGFQLDAKGLALTGDADPAREGVIMANSGGPLLMESEQPVMPAIMLVQALSPVSETQVPATPEAKTWIDLLPAPALLPAEEVSRSRPHLNLRLQKQ